MQIPLTERKLVTFRLLGQSTARPALGDAELVRFMIPPNPFRGVAVIVDVRLAPALKSVGEVALISNSGARVTIISIKEE